MITQCSQTSICKSLGAIPSLEQLRTQTTLGTEFQGNSVISYMEAHSCSCLVIESSSLGSTSRILLFTGVSHLT